MNRRSFISKLLALPVVGAIAAKLAPQTQMVDFTKPSTMTVTAAWDPAWAETFIKFVADPSLDEDVIYFVDKNHPRLKEPHAFIIRTVSSD